jgi:hypothetical protein
VKLAKTDSISPITCAQYIFPSGIKVATSSGIYYDTLSSTAGCDSILKISLIVNQVDDSVTKSGGVNLNASQNSATYQWLDCNNSNAIISGENNQNFTPTTNGNYSVEITINGCKDTSDCIAVNSVGIKDLLLQNSSISPNPSNGNFILSFDETPNLNEIYITDINGKLIKKINPSNTNIYNIYFEGKPGVYLLHLTTFDALKTYKLLKF